MTEAELKDFQKAGGDKRRKNIEGFGKPFYTLTKEKAMEIILKRPLSSDSKAYPTEWGKLCEHFAFQRLPMNYTYNTKRFTHLNLPWSGVPDTLAPEVVGDIKCPFTLKEAFELAAIRTAEELKDYSPDYYWQLVSNAILCNRDRAELTIFVPKVSRAKDILAEAVEIESLIRFKAIEELPFLPEDSDFPELTRIVFDIPEADVEFLQSRIRAAADVRDAKVAEYKNLFAI